MKPIEFIGNSLSSLRDFPSDAAVIAKKKWSQAEAAEHCGVTQPRINDLLRGRISRFSLDALVNIAAALGFLVHVELKVA
jgi:predicted XRE-type DNA-binding protein